MNIEKYEDYKELESDTTPEVTIANMLKEGWDLVDTRTKRTRANTDGSFEEVTTFCLAKIAISP